MKTLEKGQDKIKKISEGIWQEVLEPAKKEAEVILQTAREQADDIVKQAEKHAKKLVDNAKLAMEHERNVFLSSLSQSSKLTIEELKQSIQTLFNHELESVIAKNSADPKMIAALIAAIVKAIEKDGLSTDIAAVIPKHVSPKEINQLLGQELINKLQDRSVVVGDFLGGAQLRLLDKKLTFDITDQTLVEYLRNYVRKDFRKLIFAE